MNTAYLSLGLAIALVAGVSLGQRVAEERDEFKCPKVRLVEEKRVGRNYTFVESDRQPTWDAALGICVLETLGE